MLFCNHKSPSSLISIVCASKFLAVELSQHPAAAAFVQVVQGKREGQLQQGGLVVDGHAGQFQLVVFEGKPLQDIDG